MLRYLSHNKLDVISMKMKRIGHDRNYVESQIQIVFIIDGLLLNPFDIYFKKKMPNLCGYITNVRFYRIVISFKKSF